MDICVTAGVTIFGYTFVTYLHLSNNNFLIFMDKKRIFLVRLTEDQFKLIENLSKKEFKTKSEFVRSKLFRGKNEK